MATLIAFAPVGADGSDLADTHVISDALMPFSLPDFDYAWLRARAVTFLRELGHQVTLTTSEPFVIWNVEVRARVAIWPTNRKYDQQMFVPLHLKLPSLWPAKAWRLDKRPSESKLRPQPVPRFVASRVSADAPVLSWPRLSLAAAVSRSNVPVAECKIDPAKAPKTVGGARTEDATLTLQRVVTAWTCNETAPIMSLNVLAGQPTIGPTLIQALYLVLLSQDDMHYTWGERSVWEFRATVMANKRLPVVSESTLSALAAGKQAPMARSYPAFEAEPNQDEQVQQDRLRFKVRKSIREIWEQWRPPAVEEYEPAEEESLDGFFSLEAPAPYEAVEVKVDRPLVSGFKIFVNYENDAKKRPWLLSVAHPEGHEVDHIKDSTVMTMDWCKYPLATSSITFSSPKAPDVYWYPHGAPFHLYNQLRIF